MDIAENKQEEATGLLSVSVVFEIINRIDEKICENLSEEARAIVLLIVFAAMWYVPNSLTNKLWICNFDSSFVWGIYYALGHFFCVIRKSKVVARQKDAKWMHVMGIVALVASVYIYFLCQNDEAVMPFIPTILIIIANLYVANVLEGCTILARWGKYTMYCCGNEYIIRHAFGKVIRLNDWISSKIVLEIECWILGMGFVWLVVYLIYPLENYLVEKSRQEVMLLVKNNGMKKDIGKCIKEN